MPRPAALLVLPLAAVLLAGCVPAAPEETDTPVATETPTEEATDAPQGDAVMPDLGGSDLFTIDAVATYEGARIHLTLTGYVPIETGTAEAQQIDRYLREHGDTTGLFATTVDHAGSLQLLKLDVEGLDGDWPADLSIPVSGGLPGLATIVDIPSSSDGFYAYLEGTGSGYVVAGLTSDAPVTVFDWDQLGLTYGFLAAGPVGMDACDVTTTDRATSYAGMSAWVQGFCTFGVSE
jgi:hypothetical protein